MIFSDHTLAICAHDIVALRPKLTAIRICDLLSYTILILNSLLEFLVSTETVCFIPLTTKFVEAPIYCF